MGARILKSENQGHKKVELGEQKYEIAARIDEVIRESGGPSSVSKETGVSRKTLFNYANGVTDPKVLSLDCIARVCGISLDWLIAGEGTKYRDSCYDFDLEQLAAAVQTVDELENVKKLKFSPVKKTELILSIYESIVAEE